MQFQKILSYDVSGKDPEDQFNYVCALLDQTIDPISAEPKKLNADNKMVFISPRRRALTCLNAKTAVSITILPALNEIPFDLKKNCTPGDFKTYGSVAVRSTFMQLFTENQLGISHKNLKEELDYLVSISNNNPGALAISHTFRLRLLETYLRTEHQLFKKPSLIYTHLDPKTHWADFGSFINEKNKKHPWPDP